MLLTDVEWSQIEPLFEKPAKRGRGKPHADFRLICNAIVFVLIEGNKWVDIPKAEGYATKSVAHRWFVLWEKSGCLAKILERYQALKGRAPVKVPPRRKRGKKVLPPQEPLPSIAVGE